MFTTKRWLGVLVVLCLSLSLAACGGGNNGAGNAGSGNEPPVSGNAPASDNGEGSPQAQKTLTMFVDFPWWPMSDWSGKIPEAITTATGVTIHVQVASDANQLPLMIASGELPDLVFTYDHISKMSDSKVSYPWQELIDKYTPDFKIDDLTKAVNTVSDGNYYTVRDGFSPPGELAKYPKALFRGGGMALRTDIMEEIGNPEIKTLDDFLNVLGTVKEKYPDMTPLALTPGQIDSYFRLQLGLPRFGFTEVEGKPAYFIGEPRQLEYYQFMNELYTRGFITADQYTWKDPNQSKQLALTGKAFAWEYTETAAETLNAELAKNGAAFTFTHLTPMLTNKAALINNTP
ncbi:extracellular solute-binding protein, partial [Paenibacillus sepulcri]|nr:extracellular solute-binding protein [Paenibacillus sepulcri]